VNKFKKGDRVRSTRDILSFDGQSVVLAQGTPGTIEDITGRSAKYVVRFDGHPFFHNFWEEELTPLGEEEQVLGSRAADSECCQCQCQDEAEEGCHTFTVREMLRWMKSYRRSGALDLDAPVRVLVFHEDEESEVEVYPVSMVTGNIITGELTIYAPADCVMGRCAAEGADE
jgi:hypothetical protein